MKKSLSVILAFVFVIGVCFSTPFTIQSNATCAGDLTFELNEDGQSYSVVGHNITDETEIVIPSTYNDLPVTSIGHDAFRECIALTSVVIPASVKSIGDYAFNDCVALTSVTISDGLKSIGESAFYNCTVLTSINIPDSVTDVGESAFYNCYDLESVTLGNAITSISNFMFAECISLTTITIPESVTSIGGAAFYECIKLTDITIPNKVTSIGEAAFYYCRELTSITIPDSVTSIGADAFSLCSEELVFTVNNNNYAIEYFESNNLKYVINNESPLVFELNEDGQSYSVVGHNITTETEIVIPSTYNDLPVTSIGDDAFRECIALTSVVIPGSVKSIGDYAFNDCVALTSVTIPSGLTSIGEGAFYHCPVLTSIVIPDSVTSIGESAFYNCYDLSNATLGNGITSISNFMFAECMSLTSITIPDNVTSIGAAAFYECIKLTDVTIPDTVTTIGEAAFYYCRDLTSLIIPNSINSIADNAFCDCNSLEYVFYTGSLDNWNNITINSGNDCLTNQPIHYNSTGHSHNVTTRMPISAYDEGIKEDICPVCNFVNSSEKLLWVNDYITAVDTKNVVVDAITNTLVLDISACKDVNDAIIEMDGYTLTITPNSNYGYYGTGSKVQVLDDNGAQVDEHTLVVRGDVNGDSVCDVLDLMLIELARTNNRNLDGVYLTAGDLTENGEIDVDDFEAVVNKVKGI